MGEVINEIQEAINTLNLGNDIVSKTSADLNKYLYYDLLAHFVNGKDRRWWWEDFRSYVRFIRFEHPFEHLNEIIPDLTKNVWFMAEDDQESYYPIYDINPRYIKDLLAECFGFEYYIISKDYSWLLCKNHHNSLIGVGDILRHRNASIVI